MKGRRFEVTLASAGISEHPTVVEASQMRIEGGTLIFGDGVEGEAISLRTFLVAYSPGAWIKCREAGPAP